MLFINIDNQSYDVDSLSADAKAEFACLQFVDAELQRLSVRTAVLQTARTAYGNALKQALPPVTPSLASFTTDKTLKFVN